MFTKRICILVFLLFAAILIGSVNLPVLAAGQGQEDDPPERLRPDKYAYHGNEELPFLPSSNPSEVENPTFTSPIEQWSNMTFESYINDNWEIYYSNASFTNIVRLTNNRGISDIHPRLNRGCSRIVFASDRLAGVYELYAMNVDGTNLARLTSNAADDVKPAWSPDGTRIAFQTYRDGNAEVYVMNADGTGQTNLTNNLDYDGEPTWSPDGSRIAFTSHRSGGYRIWVMNADGTDPVMRSQQTYSENPAWSPDGRKILYDADDDQNGWQDLWVLDDMGQEPIRRPAGDFTAIANGWSPDSLYAIYTSVHLFYQQGEWYWDYSTFYKIDLDGFYTLLNMNRFTDWNLDWSTTDIQPPDSVLYVPVSPAPYQFTIAWSGTDNLAGIRTYDVQIKDGLQDAWTDWVMDSYELSAPFTGIGGHDYYFRMRARDWAFNLQPWPADYQGIVSVERTPPSTHINPINEFIRGDKVQLTWDGKDYGGSGIVSYDIQYMENDSGIWNNYWTDVISTTAIFSGVPGHTYHFRSRARDYAQNVESWPPGEGDTYTTFFSWMTSGMVKDNTDMPVASTIVNINPPAFLNNVSNRDGVYSAYLATNPAVKMINWSKPGYGELPATEFGIAEANVDVYLPPADNIVQDWSFESSVLPGTWSSGGAYSPELINIFYPSGNYAASLGTQPSFGETRRMGNLSSVVETYQPFAIDSAGGVHIAWPDYDHGYHIYYAYRSPDGAWSTPELVAQTASIVPAIRILTDGDQKVHMVFWQDPQGVYYTQRNSGGMWSGPELILSGGYFDKVIMDDSNNIRALIIHGMSLVYAHHASGGAWNLVELPGTEWITKSSLAVDSHGKAHIVWTSNSYEGSKVMYLVRDTNGNWSEPSLVARTGPVFSIDIVIDADDLPHVVWTGMQNGFFYSSINSSGEWGPAYDFSGDTQAYQFNLMLDNRNNLMVIWHDSQWESATRGIYFAQKDRYGTWSTPERISTTGMTPGDLAADLSGGDVYAIWAVEESSNTDLYFSRRRAGVWSSPLQITNTPLYSVLPKIIVDSKGGMNIAWAENDLAGGSSLYTISTQSLAGSGDSWLSQSFSVPGSIVNPYLSLMATTSGISEISGNEFYVKITDETSTTALLTSTTPTAWMHHWFDLAPWSGQEITLTIQLLENAGFPPADAVVDDITIGSAHADVWVNLFSDAQIAHPGDLLELHVDYGNRSAIMAATAVITLTLPAELNYVSATGSPMIKGDKLVWQVGDLPAGTSFSDISLTVEVGSADSPPHTLVTNVEISTSSAELELMNNTFQYGIYLGYKDILPLIWK